MGKIFISYRRKDEDFAHRLSEKLQSLIIGKVFIDSKISESDFDLAIEQEIRECNVFVLIVTDNTFAEDRIHENDDWIRKEVALALSLNKPVALALKQGKTPPSPDQLPTDIQKIVTKQGIAFYNTVFDECLENLAQHCVSISHGAVTLKAQEKVSPSPKSLTATASDGGVAISSENISGGIHVGASRRQELMTEIQLHVTEKENLEKYRQRLLSESTKSWTIEGIAFAILLPVALGSCALTIHPILGVAAFIGGVFYTVNTLSGTTNKDEEINSLSYKISSLDRKIQEKRSKL